MVLSRFPTSSGEVYYGEIPNIYVLKNLKSLKIDAIWNLAEELSLIIPYEKRFVREVLSANIPDFHAPPDANGFISQLNRVVSLLKSGKKVFIHCFGGHGRTGMALAAISVALDHLDAEDALDDAWRYARGPESRSQMRFIEILDDLFNGRKPKPTKAKEPESLTELHGPKIRWPDEKLSDFDKLFIGQYTKQPEPIGVYKSKLNPNPSHFDREVDKLREAEFEQYVKSVEKLLKDKKPKKP